MRLPDYLRAAVAAAPSSPAVVDGDVTWSYAELGKRAERIGAALAEVRPGAGDRVVILAAKTAQAVSAIHGVLLAGAAYVPLDPQWPEERLRPIVASVRPVAVLADEGSRYLAERICGEAPGCAVYVLREGADQPLLRVASAPGRSQPHPSASPDLAYILHTSGSTGTPKGVMLTHENAVSFVDWAVAAFAVRPGDVLSSHAPLHFDLSVFDVFAAVAARAAVVLVPPRLSIFPRMLLEFVRSQGITVWYSVPSILSAMVTRAGSSLGLLSGVRAVLFAGEPVSPVHLRTLMEHLPRARFANLYGPTETNVCTWHEVQAPPDGTTAVPIGRAIPADDVVMVAEDGRRAEVGVPGELLVGGATVMRGYWADPDRTSQAIVSHPFDPETDALYYRTGDWGVRGADGNLVLLGRRDNQVKTRGYRVELEEIEHALRTHPGVAEATVVTVPDPVMTNILCAFVVAPAEVTSQQLGAHCARLLPPYMVPHRWERADDLPRTSNGKVDRLKLSARAARMSDDPQIPIPAHVESPGLR